MGNGMLPYVVCALEADCDPQVRIHHFVTVPIVIFDHSMSPRVLGS